MSRNQYFHTVKGTILGESEKAIKFSVIEVADTLVDPPSIEWFPFSQVETITRTKTKDTDELTASEWILQKKNLI